MLLMCDVDSTLLDFDAVAAGVAHSKGIEWNRNCHWWIPPEQCGMTRQEFEDLFRICHSELCFLNVEPYPCAVEVLNTLAIDYPELKIYFVSHRHEEDNVVLQQWLSKWKFPYALNAVSTFNKIRWIEDNSPDIVIDDRVRTMVYARDFGVRFVYSLIQPWNCNLKNNEIPHIYLAESWQELGKMLNESINSLRSIDGVSF